MRSWICAGLAVSVTGFGCGNAEIDPPQTDVAFNNSNSNEMGGGPSGNENNSNQNDNSNTNGNDNSNSNENNTPPTPVAVAYETRPDNPNCVALPRPDAPGELALESDVFAGIDGADSTRYTDMRRAPVNLDGDHHWFAIVQGGEVFTWPDDHTGAPFEVREVPVSFGGELGLLGLAVDPDYPSVAEPNMVRLFINYTATCRSGGGPCSFLERFDVDIAAGNGAPTVRAADPDNGYENPSVLFSTRQPAGNHNAGALLFDDAGLLYMSLGDGGSGDDPWCSGLNLYTPLGKVLRFDVHSGEVPYGIPAGNPFTEGSEGKCDNQIGALADDTPDLSRTEPCPEIFAYGLRNPFRMSYDSVRDAVWIGDVGQDAQEEIHFIDATADRPNFNLGWPAREGSEAKPGGLPDACTTLGEERDPLNTDYTAPRFIYRHTREQSSRSSVVAGFVYRGSALGDAYVGSFIFGDFGSSEIWVMDSPYGEGTIDVNGQEIEISERHVAYAEDENGEIYIVTLGGPRRFVLADPSGNSAPFPQRLTEHPCFSAANPRNVVDGVIPYETTAQLWSDGASKRRFLAVPDGTTIDRASNCGSLNSEECTIQGEWELPIGSVLIKEFALDSVAVETRVFMRHEDGGWGSYSYAWDENQDDAVLQESAFTRDFGNASWTYPGLASCARCHTNAAGITLGLETRQLNSQLVYPGNVEANQLDSLDHIGLLSPALDGDEDAFPVPGTGMDVENEARAYLHSNCSMCHRPGGGTGSGMVLTYDTPLSEMGICGVESQGDWPTLTDPLLLAPGAPERSVIPFRMSSTESNERMPPVGTDIPDPVGVEAVRAWIASLTECP